MLCPGCVRYSSVLDPVGLRWCSVPLAQAGIPVLTKMGQITGRLTDVEKIQNWGHVHQTVAIRTLRVKLHRNYNTGAPNSKKRTRV